MVDTSASKALGHLEAAVKMVEELRKQLGLVRAEQPAAAPVAVAAPQPDPAEVAVESARHALLQRLSN